MSVLQLIRDGEQDLEPTPNPRQLGPLDIAKNAFLAGSDDLIFIALHLSLRGFRVLDFYIVNRYFVPVDEEEREWLSDELIRLLEAEKPTSIRRFIDRHMTGRFVEQVRFQSEGTDNQLTIAQQGVVNARDEDVATLRKSLSEVSKIL